MSVKITALPVEAAPTIDDIVAMVDLAGPTTKRVTLALLKALLASPGGAANELQYNDGAGGLAGVTGFRGGANHVDIGTAPVASQGELRIPTAGASCFMRDSANATDFCIWKGIADNAFFGTDDTYSKQCTSISVYASTAVGLGLAGSTYLYIYNGNIEHWFPCLGSSAASSPYGQDGVGTQAMANTNQTAASSVYCFGTIKTTGAITANRTLTLPTATDAGAYRKVINNTCTGAFSIVVSVGAGTTITIANARSAWVLVDSRGVTRLTADSVLT